MSICQFCSAEFDGIREVIEHEETEHAIRVLSEDPLVVWLITIPTNGFTSKGISEIAEVAAQTFVKLKKVYPAQSFDFAVHSQSRGGFVTSYLAVGR